MAGAIDQFEGASLWVHLPFVLYARLFLKTSFRISRAQELAADACAARVKQGAPAAARTRCGRSTCWVLRGRLTSRRR